MCALCTTSLANTCFFILYSHSFLTLPAEAGAQGMHVCVNMHAQTHNALLT